MNSQTQEVCKAIVQLIKSLNISMETLVAYNNGYELENAEENNSDFTTVVSKAKSKKKTKKVKEEVKEEAKEETKEETKEEVKIEIKQNDSPSSKKMWADYDDDEEFTQITKTSYPPLPVEKSVVVETSAISYKHIVDKHAKTNAKKTTSPPLPPPLPKCTNDKKTFAFKHVPKKNITKDLPIAYTKAEFLEFIREKKQPSVDFTIHESAHCDHTYKGTLCPNAYSCNTIHIQRCTQGTYCKHKVCPFLHKKDMLTTQAEINFDNTISEYNRIKPNKQVRV